MAGSSISAVLDRRDALLQIQQEIYITTITNINMRNRELLKNDFGATLARNCVGDLAGEIVRRYFNTSDYYITADQMAQRLLSFSYEDDFDPLGGDEFARKAAYNASDSPEYSSFLQTIEKQNQQAQRKLFEKEKTVSAQGKERSQYIDHKMIEEGKAGYKEAQNNPHDELTGAGPEHRLQVDHVQAAATITYNSQYFRDEFVQHELKQFYNSPDNFQMLAGSANSSKGDVRVYSDGKKTYSSTEIVAMKKQLTEERISVYRRTGMDPETALKQAREDAKKEIEKTYEDITYKASAHQVADAVCDRWENAGNKENLMKSGHLDANGKVPAKVRKELEEHLRHSMNAESVLILKKGISYGDVAKDAGEETKQGISRIIIGQVVYYVLPPVLFETQQIIRKKNMTLERFLKEIKHAGGRIFQYVKSKMGEILRNVAINSLHKFVKSFFDIIISLVKETVRRLVKIAKSLLLSLVQSIKILTNKHASPAEKADAVTKLLAASIVPVVLEILYELLEDALGINDYITEPLQMILTIVAVNLVMLILQKADLFDVQYGILVANMEQAFSEERQNYLDRSERAIEEVRAEMSYYMDELADQIAQIESSIEALDLYADDALPGLEEINRIFAIGIDFQAEWDCFSRKIS